VLSSKKGKLALQNKWLGKEKKKKTGGWYWNTTPSTGNREIKTRGTPWKASPEEILG